MASCALTQKTSLSSQDQRLSDEHFPLMSGLWMGTYQTVPVSKAADTDRALSILDVKTADTRP